MPGVYRSWKADRWFPSSKQCAQCDRLNHSLAPADREWTCTGCGTIHDRDDDAAANLRRGLLAERTTTST
ncbi:zinc ribbon domain-containing protein [Kribbella sp. NPDC003557]|uniref:zinc ribbon domain-containing protein n=1 Tax=Kribbella sp. NPDC003557 TaxID=3154449 RepID=UPI0033B9EE61